jgi:hypothetical protein
MKLYHGSKIKLDNLKSQQAENSNPDNVPKDEIKKAIYLTPDYGRAIAMGARPEGDTFFDDENHKITFENPKLFNPEQDIYIYCLDSNMFTINELKLGENGLDYVAEVDDNREIIPEEIKTIKARNVLDYYELTNWKENSEINHSFKVK